MGKRLERSGEVRTVDKTNGCGWWRYNRHACIFLKSALRDREMCSQLFPTFTFNFNTAFAIS